MGISHIFSSHTSRSSGFCVTYPDLLDTTSHPTFSAKHRVRSGDGGVCKGGGRLLWHHPPPIQGYGPYVPLPSKGKNRRTSEQFARRI